MSGGRDKAFVGARQMAMGLSLAMVAALVSGCRPTGTSPSQTAATGVGSSQPTAVASHVAPIDCPALGAKPPTEAAASLEAAGYNVFWRRVHTAADGTTLNDIVSQPPAGVIADIALDTVRGEAYIFVADPADPAAHSRSSPHC